VGMKADRDTGDREVVWAIDEQLGGSHVEARLKYRSHSPAWLLADVGARQGKYFLRWSSVA